MTTAHAQCIHTPLHGHVAIQMESASQSEASDSEGDRDPLSRLPYEILLHLFGYVPPRDLIDVCRLVCKGWRGLFEEPSFWQLRMKQRGNYDSKLDHLSGVNWAKLCLYTVHEPNLIKSFNSRGDLSLTPWRVTYQDWGQFAYLKRFFTGDLYRILLNGVHVNQQCESNWYVHGWSIEEWIKRDDAKDQDVLKENNGCTKNYVAMYDSSSRWQLIDLYKCGFTQSLMDEIQPPIHVSEWICINQGKVIMVFNVVIALLDRNFKLLKTYEHSEEWDLGWRKMKHVFHDYGVGVRYVLFVDGGKCPRWEEGHRYHDTKLAACVANVHVELTQ